MAPDRRHREIEAQGVTLARAPGELATMLCGHLLDIREDDQGLSAEADDELAGSRRLLRTLVVLLAPRRRERIEIELRLRRKRRAPRPTAC